MTSLCIMSFEKYGCNKKNLTEKLREVTYNVLDTQFWSNIFQIILETILLPYYYLFSYVRKTVETKITRKAKYNLIKARFILIHCEIGQ